MVEGIAIGQAMPGQMTISKPQLTHMETELSQAYLPCRIAVSLKGEDVCEIMLQMLAISGARILVS
jgi:hypothetical protein